MLPRPHANSTDPTTTSNAVTPTSTQHGRRSATDSPDPTGASPGLDERSGLVASQDSGRSTGHGAGQERLRTAEPGHAFVTDADKLRSGRSGKRTPSPVDKIVEHERASSKFSSGQTSSTGFRVISRSKNAPAPRLSLHDLPAEVLTHVCSYLPADTFSAMSLVSRRIHQIVTEQHAWRMAFARYFTGHESLRDQELVRSERSGDAPLASEKRFFTRLTAISSWRNEYVIRTRLLRCLSKGSPSDIDQLTAKTASRASNKITRLSQVDYAVEMMSPVTAIEGSFAVKNNQPRIRLIHGSAEEGRATVSDPLDSTVFSCGLQAPFEQFYEIFPSTVMYGLGAGEIVGVPNSMDVSPLFGLVIGIGSPGSWIHYRHLDEQRGLSLQLSVNRGFLTLGIPRIDPARESVTASWIAKSKAIPNISSGQIGAMFGTSSGTIVTCALGTDGNSNARASPASVSASWVLSPGVPIVAFGVDEQYSAKRQKLQRVWAFALNALGEVFYLKTLPTLLPESPRVRPQANGGVSSKAWEVGRTVYWELVECTRRKAKPDPFGDSETDGSYSPRSSADCHGLSQEQIAAETKEIEGYIAKPPMFFRANCEGWDMQRRLEVDFAGDDEHGAGESIIVINCGLVEGQPSSMRRYTRMMIEDTVRHEHHNLSSDTFGHEHTQSSLFGGPERTGVVDSVWDVKRPTNIRRLSQTPSDGTLPEERFEVWRVSEFSFGYLKVPQISASASDKSSYAQLTIDEDPLLGLNVSSTDWSPMASPLPNDAKLGRPTDVPGQRAKLCAVGTKIGAILVWNMRASISTASDVVNVIEPVCVIHTDSPGIASLAMTALYLVHGGSDGLVQAWDPLGSTKEPIRTLHSKFTQRARRDLRQNQARPHGVGINYYAAHALCLDPDPKVLRGAVSIGTRIRYWSYSSSSADSFRAGKRRNQRDRRGSNNTGADPKVTRTGRGALADYIANEQADLERAKRQRQKETERFNARFGSNLLGEGATDDEIMAYVTMISEESYASDNARRLSITSSNASSIAGSPGSGLAYPPSIAEETDDTDAHLARALQSDDDELAEALRRSLQDSNAEHTPDPETDFSAEDDVDELGFTVKYATLRRNKRSPRSTGSRSAGSDGSATFSAGGSSRRDGDATEQDDLAYALQLSLAEEASRKEISTHSDWVADQEHDGSGAENSYIDSNAEVQGKGKNAARN